MNTARWKRTWAATRWLLVICWMGVIFGFSSLTGSQIPGHFSWLGHLGEYAILGGLLIIAFALPERVVAALTIASAYGVTDELHQVFVQGRTPDPVDWLVDTVGAALGILVVRSMYRAILARRSQHVKPR